MSGSLNKVTLIGHLGKEPEVKMMPNGGKLVNISLATTESWKDKATGEKKDKTEWHRVVIFNEALANVAERFLTKGSKIYLEGQLQTRKYQDKDGVEKYSTEVVVPKFSGSIIMLDNKGGSSSTSSEVADEWSPSPNGKIKPDNKSIGEDLDDEIPF